MRIALLVFFFLAEAAYASRYAALAGAVVEPYVRSNNFSGVILVDHAGTTLARAAYGLADVEHNVPMTTDARFYIASLSKSFTAAAILQLRDAGKLTLDDPLSRFVPDFPRAERISVRQLLTHRSGLPQDSAVPDYLEIASRTYTLQEAVDLIRKATPASEPGVRRSYSNSNYVLLAMVVERASGEAFSNYLQRHLFAPLKMTGTGLHKSWVEVVPARARGYSPAGVRDLCNARPFDYSIGTGAGSAWSTADDLRRWMRGLRSGAVLRRGSVDEMFGLSGAEAYVGGPFGDAKHRAVELTGWDGVGFAAALIDSTADDDIVIVLTNRNVPTVASDVAETLARLQFGERTVPLDLDDAPISRAAVRGLAGRYRLGDDFFVPGTVLDLVECDTGICERQSDGRLIALLRTKSGDYIHRSSWGRVRFHIDAGSATGLLFYGRFEAVPVR